MSGPDHLSSLLLAVICFNVANHAMNLHFVETESAAPLKRNMFAALLTANAVFALSCHAFGHPSWTAGAFAGVSVIVYPLMYWSRLLLLRGPVPEGYLPPPSVPLSSAEFAIRRMNASSGLARTLKRMADLLAAGALLLLLAPLMAAVSLLIWMDDGSPVVIRQRRVGLNGRTFDMLKFRSMHVNAESDGVARFTAEHDRRISRIGRVIRRHRIDELPQLVNVLKGEMSLVGPRPERPAFVREADARSPHYDVRHIVVPGMTGWAQINYPYGDTIEDVIAVAEYDIYYISNWSLLLDLSIFLRTTYVVLFGVGAR